MDLMSFRDLYGYATPEKIAATKQLEKDSGAKFVDRADAEASLFGGGGEVTQGQQTSINDRAELGSNPQIQKAQDLNERVYSPAEISQGVAIEAAIILKDPAQLKQTLKDIQKASADQKLGLAVVDWQDAAGNIGHFVQLCKLILIFATGIIFVVAIVIMNNAVVMATLQRVREIGTLRAIGAQRSFVLSMVLCETVVLGLAFGTLGALLGSGFVGLLNHYGIGASNEFLYFFFSGPRLYPGLSFGSLIGAFVVVVIVTCASALYPAVMATRVSPIQAMASED
jgi:ABC-type antimicrobial peptide transport system permease subunit